MSGETQGGPIRSIWHRIAPFLVVLIFGGAVWLLYRELRHYSFADVRDAIVKIPAWQIVLSCGLTILNYVILVGYDVLAVKSVGHPLPLRRVALASFTGFATSYSFGALLGGGSVRFRLYSAWGLSPTDIVQLVLILGFTFWFGVFALAGAIFLIHPFEISQEWHLPTSDTRALGVPLILMAVAYLATTVLWKKPIHVRGRDVKLPGFAMSSAQLAVAAGDSVVAAGCFYVLLPAGIEVSYASFLGVYLLAVVVVVLTHVPGGAGVFELVVLTTCPVANKELLLAAILAFRVIYYLVPLLAAAVILALYEVRLRSRLLRRSSRETKDSPSSPP